MVSSTFSIRGRMFREMTRSNVIQGWFAALTLAIVVAIASGAAVSLGTGAFALTLSLAPAVIVLMLWPTAAACTAADVLYASDRRG
jgi:hypothetical protein